MSKVSLRLPVKRSSSRILISKAKMEIMENKEFIRNMYESVTGKECRICLKEPREIRELFRNGNGIPEKLMAVASVQVKEGDGLPGIICLSCNQLLDASYDFKLQIQRSDEKLREILKLKSENSVSSRNIVKAIIADVISTVICSTKEGSLEPCNTQHDVDTNDRLYRSFQKNETFPSDKEFSRYDKDDANARTFDSSYKTKFSPVHQEDTKTLNDRVDIPIKQEELQLPMDEGIVSNNVILKSETKEDDMNFTEESTLCRLENSLDSRTIDEEEKPLIWRTARLRCSHCIKSFRSQLALQTHSIVHKRKTKLRYVCYMCDKQYSSIAKLKNHVAISHEETQEKKADASQEEKRTVRATRKSYETTKEEKKRGLKFVCKVCSKEFTYQKSFVTHARSHTEYKAAEAADSNLFLCPDKETARTDVRNVDHEENEQQENEEEGEQGNEEEDVEEEEEEKKEQEEEEEEEEEEEVAEEEGEDDGDMPAENLQCTQCGKLFATERNLKRHITTHSGLKYNCTTCGKGFSRVDKLKDHEQLKHKTEIFENSDTEDKEDVENVNKSTDCTDGRKKERHNRPHKCAMCPKSFAQPQSLANHMERHKRVKETQKRFLCEVCSKCFAQSSSLVAHMRTHTGVKPYVCNVCSRAFTKGAYLQLHLRTHSGEKPYICQYCSRAFARTNTLARHITMHTGEAKYHCQICTKSFRRLTSLHEHTYTHTGQRPYACKICTKRYNNAGSLYAHKKKCKAQQLTTTGSFAVSVESGTVQQTDPTIPQVLIYSQRKLTNEATAGGQVAPTSQYMLANVHNQKSLPNIIPPFAVDDPNVYALNSKQFKNPYYAIYPNM